MLLTGGLLAWQPAHLAMVAIGERKLSNGARLTAADWRANRLADGMAKFAARRIRMPDGLRELLESAAEANRHAAMLLAQVTFAANNYITSKLNADGVVETVTLRDSQDKPVTRKRPLSKPGAGGGGQPSLVTHASCDGIQPWKPPLQPQRHSKRLKSAARCEAEQEVQDVKRHLGQLSSTLSMPCDSVGAADKLEAVKRRVMARLACRSELL